MERIFNSETVQPAVVKMEEIAGEQKEFQGGDLESEEEDNESESPPNTTPDIKMNECDEPPEPPKTRPGRKRKKLDISDGENQQEDRKEVDRFTYYQQIKYYIRENKYPDPSMTYGEKRVLRKAARAYTLDGDVLYYRHMGALKKILETQEDILEVVKANHVDPLTEKHNGQCLTLRKISDKYYWKHMKHDVDSYIKECEACKERLMVTAAWMERRKSALEHIVHQGAEGDSTGARGLEGSQLDPQVQMKLMTPLKKKRKEETSEGEPNEGGREVDRFWFYQQVKYYLWAARYLDPSMTNSEKRVVRKASHAYSIGEGNKLYYRHKGINKKILESDDEVLQVMKSHHVDPVSEKHYGQCLTLSKISQKFYWKHMKNDVDTYIRDCEICKVRPTVIAQSSFVVKSTKPLELVVMDVLGPFPPTLTGFKFVCTITDHYSKWVEFYPLKEKCHVQVAAAVKSFLSRFGAPGKFVSEMEEQFVSQVNSVVGYKYKMNSKIIPEPATQYRGLDQKTLRFFKNKLGALFKEHDNDWDQHLDEVAYVVRTQKAVPTRKQNPYFLMFGREPNNIEEVNIEEERPAPPVIQTYTHPPQSTHHQYNHQIPVTNNIAVSLNPHHHGGHQLTATPLSHQLTTTPLNHQHHIPNTFSRPQINSLNEEVLATEMISVIYEMS